MKIKYRSKAYAFMGVGSCLLSVYSLQKSAIYLKISGDTVGVLLFALAGIALIVVSVAHFYMAAGYGLGKLETVTGEMESATLLTKDGVVATAVKIRFLRSPDSDDLTAERYKFFIGGWKPWVCPESGFLKS